MSNSLAPSKTTVYVSNLPFSLTNNDLHKIFEKYGPVVKVTILKDKVTRKSRGCAFILFKTREDTHKCIRALDAVEMFGRTLKVSLAKDNGRAPEFIRRREYPDKSRCYECGESGHLSNVCPKNLLGIRELPPKKKKRTRHDRDNDEGTVDTDDDNDSVNSDWEMSWASLTTEVSASNENMTRHGESSIQPTKKRYKTDSYFSDEEELEDN